MRTESREVENIDFEVIKNLVGNNEELFQKVLRGTSRIVAETITLLENHRDDPNNEAVERQLHKVKPNLDYFGLESAVHCKNAKDIILAEEEGDLETEIDQLITGLYLFQDKAQAELNNNGE